ncbi:Mix paired-like homeobox [Desmophyllum pertusum]|uniref:Mix paired-like homeobox n=1 Tax=Desmophyllum pertusum TaxID=174260 RepID=A0A9W9ZAR5_9CNID|nr:Mix paired-like homeobox [Desmophyllum pertusum]KAJ7378273.1 Mix paired-like homeobox [Desmophyllum pertusum]
MVDRHQDIAKPNNLTPDVLEAASILVAMKRGMRYFLLEAQQAQARFQLSYLDFNSLNPGSAHQLHYFSGHRIPFSPLYDISPMPAAYHFPLAHAQTCSLPQPVAYYGMLASQPCFVGPPREQSAACVASTEGVVESETIQRATKKIRLSNASTSSPETAVSEKQESKRKRKNLTKEQLEILEAVYAKDKYPHIEDRLKLEEPTKLTEDRIQVWFQNRRAKDRKKLEAEKLQQYFAINSQKVIDECEGSDDIDAKNASDSPTKATQRIKRENSNSSSDISDNGEFDNLSFSESQTE